MENFKEAVKDPVKACYIHIPFCQNICTYCDFCKMYYQKDYVTKYLKGLEKEIKTYYNNDLLNTLYIGGGTPSCLDKKSLEELFRIINLLKLNNDYEFTFECNIEDLNEELLKFLKTNKVNRLSIGVQSFHDKYLKFLGRSYKEKEIKTKIKLCQKYFSNINIDLIFGIKGETKEELKTDLDSFLSLNIPHIAIYALILENNTMLKINNYQEIEDEISRDYYFFIIKYLKKHGFLHYEISNFSKKGYFSKHNLTYWNNDKYYGFGLGAGGYIDNIRYLNTRSLTNYLKGNYRHYEEVITKDLEEEYFMILGLRKTKGISALVFYNKFKKPIEEVFDLKKLKYQNGYYYIDTNNLYISNYILEDFIK